MYTRGAYVGSIDPMCLCPSPQCCFRDRDKGIHDAPRRCLKCTSCGDWEHTNVKGEYKHLKAGRFYLSARAELCTC